ncbi:MAG: hypothetical protein HQK56_15555 [Deltaproteobacteria bacterium]|nr:hypothetical protein [Deltaproteobacteria bacterium]
MGKTLITIIITAVAVLFGLQNFDHVPVYGLWGKPIAIRMTYLVATAGVFGYLIRHFAGIRREEKLRKQLRIVLNHKSDSVRKKAAIFDEEGL